MAQAGPDPTTAASFAAFATFLGTPLPENPIAAVRILRREAAKEVERLIEFLDALGGDPDLEPAGDEQDASFPEGWRPLSFSPSNVLAFPHEDAEDDGNGEPSLASPEAVRTSEGRNEGCWGDDCPRRDRAGRQTHWARGNSNDLEGDAHEDQEDGHDAEDDRADDEPTLGWTDIEARHGKYAETLMTGEAEPSNGALLNIDQSLWGFSETKDREPNGDELDADHAGGEGR